MVKNWKEICVQAFCYSFALVYFFG